jgi:mannosidase alpha-like ER degradation enhancer 2
MNRKLLRLVAAAAGLLGAAAAWAAAARSPLIVARADPAGLATSAPTAAPSQTAASLPGPTPPVPAPSAAAPGTSPALASVPLPTDRAQLAARVRAEVLHAWQGYERYAWGHDELRPLAKVPRDWYAEPLLMTPVDALDTLLLVGLREEAEKARALIVERLSFDRDLSVKNFEITIRLLGGLLSGYQMTGDPRLLRLAQDLGARLLPAFGSPTGMPFTFVNLKTGQTSGPRSNPAEIGTLLLEFGTLSRLTGNQVFYDKAKNALVQLYKRRSKIGLVGEEIDVRTGEWTSTASHVGGGIDSYYEYLLKSSLLFGDAECGRMYSQSLAALNRYLLDDAPTGLWYGQADMVTGERTATEFGALHAFFPAVLALGGNLGLARRLEDSCYKMWTLHGIEPEVIDYRTMRVVSPGYPLRPEIVESAYYLRHATGDARYVEMGRTFFAGLLAHCRTDAGFTVLASAVTREKGDLMPSYFLAETLKYLYLIFAPDEALDFARVIFNTEGHPLRRDAPLGRASDLKPQALRRTPRRGGGGTARSIRRPSPRGVAPQTTQVDHALLRYFIPVSHMTVTMVASGPSCSANRRAAVTLPPVEVPPKRPSSRASRMAMVTASSVETCAT